MSKKTLRVLLIVDVQNDFCPGGALAVADGDQVVIPINALMKSGYFDHVVASKDWHPANHVSFAANHAGKHPFESIELNGKPQTLWPRHCEQNSPGAELHPALRAELINHIVNKGTAAGVDSYSAFFDNDGVRETGLGAYLKQWTRAQGLELKDIELTVCGLATDYCVKFTALDAMEKLQLKTRLLVDGCRAVNIQAGDDLKAFRELTAAGAGVVESKEIFAELARERGMLRPVTPEYRTPDTGERVQGMTV